MATKNKGGRPPRAPGEKMMRLSVVLRPIYREALDILAREQHTSVSQVLESLLAQALRTKKVKGRPLLEVAERMAWNQGDSSRSRLYRIYNQPFKTPDELYALNVIEGVKDQLGIESQHVLSNDMWLAMLFGMIDQCFKMGSPPDFCAEMFMAAKKHDGGGGGRYFYYADPAGIEYDFDLQDYMGIE